jgi:hypothetical protein
MARARSPEEHFAAHGTIDVRQQRKTPKHPRQPNGPAEAENGESIVPFPSSTLAELARKPEIARRFLDSGQRIPMRTVTLLSGDGGTGKSLLAGQLVLATGDDTRAKEPLQWLGADILERGNAVIIAAEDEEQEVRRRLAQMCRLAGIDPMNAARVHVISLAEEPDTTLAIEERGVLKATKLFRRVEAALDLIEDLKLIVLDNVADVYGANEIIRHLVRAFVSRWRRIAIRRDCAVLLLFHPSQAGLRDGSGTSGSTAWHNSAKSRLYLERIKDENGREPDQDRRLLKSKKANYARLGEDIELVYDDGQFVAVAPSRPFDDVTVAHLDQVRAAFASGDYKADPRSPEWGGFFVADLLGLSIGGGLPVKELASDEKKNRQRVGTILAQWIRAKEICIVQRRDRNRRVSPHYSIPGASCDDTEMDCGS